MRVAEALQIVSGENVRREPVSGRVYGIERAARVLADEVRRIDTLREQVRVLREALKQISHAKADRLDHSIDATLVERAAHIAKRALAATEPKP